jgi:hypothetical protein
MHSILYVSGRRGEDAVTAVSWGEAFRGYNEVASRTNMQSIAG